MTGFGHRAASLALAAAAGASAAGSAHAQALPQLDATTFAPQLVWLAISFALLYVIMWRIAIPRVRDVLDERQRRVDDALAKAEALKAEAETAMAAYEKLLGDARAEAHAAVRAATEKAAREAALRQHEAAERLAREAKAAEGRIAAAKADALAKLGDMATEVAAAAVERLAGERAEAGALRQAVDRALKERAV